MSKSRKKSYIYGNTARKYTQEEFIKELKKTKRKKIQTQKNRFHATLINFSYVIFLIGMLVISGLVLIGYISLHSDIATLNEQISGRNKYLNNLKIENDDKLTQIEASIDVEKIKRVVIGEMGMGYPTEEQIIYVKLPEYDYVRKIDDE